MYYLFIYSFIHVHSCAVCLDVAVAPLVSASMNVVGAVAGSDVRIKCSVESYPPSVNFWIKGRTTGAGGDGSTTSPAIITSSNGSGNGGGNNERNILLTGYLIALFYVIFNYCVISSV
jgi:hypothetical protein